MHALHDRADTLATYSKTYCYGDIMHNMHTYAYSYLYMCVCNQQKLYLDSYSLQHIVMHKNVVANLLS